MVGHTHEDIDQSFSCLSRYLRKNDALSMPGISNKIGGGHTNAWYSSVNVTILAHG